MPLAVMIERLVKTVIDPDEKGWKSTVMREVAFGRLFKYLYYNEVKNECISDVQMEEDKDNQARKTWVKNKKRKFYNKAEKMGMLPFIDAIKIKNSRIPRFCIADTEAVREILDIETKEVETLSKNVRIRRWLLIVETLERWKHRYCMAAKTYEDLLIEGERGFGLPPMAGEKDKIRQEKNKARYNSWKRFLKDNDLDTQAKQGAKLKELDEILEEVKEKLARFYHLDGDIKGGLDREFLDVVVAARLLHIQIPEDDIDGLFSKDDHEKEKYISDVLCKIDEMCKKTKTEDPQNGAERSDLSFRQYYEEQRPSLSKELSGKIKAIVDKLERSCRKRGGLFGHIKDRGDGDKRNAKELIWLGYILSHVRELDDDPPTDWEQMREEIYKCNDDAIKELKAQYLQYTGREEITEKIDLKRLLYPINIDKLRKFVRSYL